MMCDWPLDEGCLGSEWEDMNPALKERALELSINTLRRLTAYRVGGCPVTVRPVVSKGACFVPTIGGNPWMSPGVSASGQWVNNCGRDMGLRRNEVVLPPPVGRIDEVKVDGVALDAADYRLDNGYLLVWMGEGDAPWPTNQDVTKPDTEEGTFSVTYLNAHEVDSGGAYAAAVLATEFAKACNGGKCRLPAGVTTIARQGVTMQIASGAFPDGLTGIREVDAWVALWNPDGRAQGSRVWTPDMGVRRTGS